MFLTFGIDLDCEDPKLRPTKTLAEVVDALLEDGNKVVLVTHSDDPEFYERWSQVFQNKLLLLRAGVFQSKQAAASSLLKTAIDTWI